MRFEDTLGISHTLKAAEREMRQRLEMALQPLGLTSAQYTVLSTLEVECDLTNAELARRCYVTPQTMNRIMQNLEDSGFVKKSTDESHALKLQFKLTAHAKKLVCTAHIAVNQVELDMVKALNKKEIRQLEDLLKRLYNRPE